MYAVLQVNSLLFMYDITRT